MDPATLTAEALRAGPIVLIIWLLLNRLERRFDAYEKDAKKRDEARDARLGAIEARLADGTLAARVGLLEARAAEDRQRQAADDKACAERVRLVEGQLVAVWQKIGDRPGDRVAG